MRIAMFLDTHFPPDSRVENEALSLIESGHEIHLFTLNYNDGPTREIINGIHVYRFPVNVLTYKSSALAFTIPFYKWKIKPMIRQFIKMVQPKTLHVHDMILAPPVIELGKLFGLFVTLDLHENRPVIMKEYNHLKKFPGNMLINVKKWEHAQQHLVAQADNVIVVTEEAKNQLMIENNMKQEKIVVVPNTIHNDLYLSYPLQNSVLEKIKGGFNLLYMGDTGLRRGTDTAIQAVSLLRDTIPEIRLILVGKNSEDTFLQEMVRDLHLEDKVQFEGWQDVSLFPSYVHQADICLSPLKRNLHHDTTYANKIFQYMAGGKVLVVSDCPAQARVIKATHCGLVHMAENPADLADKVLELYGDPSKRKRMGENGKKAVESDWNWDSTSTDLLKFYDNLSDLLQ